MAYCRACQAEIRFIETPSGGHMPVNPELVKTFLIPLAIGDKPVALVTERGNVVRGKEVSLTHKDAEAVEGYQPHWATCSKPKDFRKA